MRVDRTSYCAIMEGLIFSVIGCSVALRAAYYEVTFDVGVTKQATFFVRDCSMLYGSYNRTKEGVVCMTSFDNNFMFLHES